MTWNITMLLSFFIPNSISNTIPANKFSISLTAFIKLFHGDGISSMLKLFVIQRDFPALPAVTEFVEPLSS